MGKVKEMKVSDNSQLEQYAVHHSKYTMLYDFIPHGYFTLDREGSILELNRNGYRMLGLESANSARYKFIRYLTHDTQAIFTEFLEKIFESEEKQTCKVSIVIQDSPEIYTRLEGMSFDNGSKCILLACDITDYEMLKKKTTRYKNIFESLEHGILTIDADNGKITDVNQTLSDLIGFDTEQIMGKYIWEIPIFSEIITSEKELPSLLNNLKKHYSFEIKGNSLDLEVVSNAYEFDHTKEIQLNFKDISERTQYLNALEESQASLEALNSAKDKFFSILSHDLRSPFNSILGFTELLNEKIDREDYRKVKQYSQIIQKSSWNAMELLTNLLEWSRSLNNKIDFKPENISLSPLVDEVLKFSEPAAEQKSITLTKEIENISLVADKAMLNTVLRNLISNAIKFTHCGGQVKVSAKLQNDSVKISISDNGIGMEPQLLEHLFEFGEKQSRKGTMQETGTGLGLVLCKEFVQKHQGTIWAESNVDEGSTFHFTIPDGGSGI